MDEGEFDELYASRNISHEISRLQHFRDVELPKVCELNLRHLQNSSVQHIREHPEQYNANYNVHGTWFITTLIDDLSRIETRRTFGGLRDSAPDVYARRRSDLLKCMRKYHYS